MTSERLPHPEDPFDLAAREGARLEALDRLDALDEMPGEPFDRIARLVKNIFGLPIVLVSVIDAHRQLFKANHGLVQSEIARRDTFCTYTIQRTEPLFVEDAREDSRFMANPYVIGDPLIRCYAGVPLRTEDGHNIGTICALGHETRQFDERERLILNDLAAVAMDEFELRRRVVMDGLTGILSRSAFREEGARAFAFAARTGRELACVMFDLDHFKSVNDTHGHAAGDKVLTAAVNACVGQMRNSDIIGRLGGEEFGVLLPSTSVKDAYHVVNKLRVAIEEARIDLGQRLLNVTASFGLTGTERSVSDFETMLARADAALYEAKAQGRNRCVEWKPAIGSGRRRVLKAGVILYNNRMSTIDCTVRTIGDDGAGIDLTSSAGVPENFHLVIASDRFEANCRLAARAEKHLEVSFV